MGRLLMKCFCAGRRRDCYGAMTSHHIVSKQRIKRHAQSLGIWRPGQISLDMKAAVKDARNLIGVCWGCHQLIEGGSLRVELGDLPIGFWAFVQEYGLQGHLPRHLQGHVPAALEAA